MASRTGDDPGSAVWRSAPLRLALVFIPLWFTVAVLVFNVGWRIKLIVGLVFGVTLVAPAQGLLLTAAFAPLGNILTELDAFRMGEAIVLAFLVAWAIRGEPDRRGPRVPAPAVGALFATVVVASMVGLAWRLRGEPGALPETFDLLWHAYYLVGDRMGVVDGARLLEGVALVAAVVMLFRRSPRLAVTLPVAMAAAASAAAAASVVAWLHIGGYRVSGHVRDINAAGSYFAMVLCLTLGMALRARGVPRFAWIAAAIATGVGLWFSESRTAVASVGIAIVLAATWYRVARWTPRARAVTIAAIFAVGLAVTAFRFHQFNFGADYRRQFYGTSSRMILARPLFGVGVGQYYSSSALFMSPQLAWNYGFENAHNNFLQIGAELGLIGLLLFVGWIGVTLARTAGALAIEPRDSRLLGLAAGVTAFVASWSGGHPLLVGEVAFPFWIQLGLTAALAGSIRLDRAAGDAPREEAGDARAAHHHPAAVAAGLLLMMAAAIGSSSRPVEPPRSPDVDGFYGWETASDGTRYRWSGQFASLFVPGYARHVEFPIKVPSELRLLPRLEVDVMAGGALQSRATATDSWAVLGVTLPEANPAVRFRRIDLRVDRTWQPAIYIAGSADMRAVGIQVGEPTFR